MPDPSPPQLLRTPDRLELHIPGDSHPFYIDLSRVDGSSPQGRSLRQPIAKALGLKKGDPHRPTVLDATAGLGEDACLMAALGCHVTALERNPTVHALLEDALRRLAHIDPDTASRITLMQCDSITRLAAMSAEVVYLDPMFPAKRKAMQRKPMRLLQQLVGLDEDSDALWQAAIGVALRRVVVKRPRKAPPVGDKPDLVFEARSLRYDVYLTIARSKKSKGT
ncbi:MAG: 16S rRNA (guanine(1516)-N(2))-methyltransferase [Phycisphaera sp.]|nr:16S rRNA (guanine(1516)-N(2))-methyltransferase [Phycisphaera sp.]